MIGRKTRITAANLPRSVTSGAICFAGLLSFMITVYEVRIHNINNYLGGVFCALGLAIPIIILEYLFLKTFRKPSTGLDFSRKNKISVKRVMIKLLGLYATLMLVAAYYWVFPVYHNDYYVPYWVLAKAVLVIILILSIPYFFILDRFLVEPEESYWKVGMIVLGKWKEINADGLKSHFLGWLVKAFFLPLMFVSLSGNIGVIKQNPLNQVMSNFDFSIFYNYTLNYIFTIDLVFVTVGYLLTLRIFDSHIRSVEPSFLGWYVALQCYQPFWGMLSGSYYAYDDGYFWGDWLWNYEHMYVLWGSIILILMSIYTWASLYFGIRFSNLTHRGIITNGPYRLMRHPAYVSKNLAWWFISIPFISHESVFAAVNHCLLLLFLNIIYFLRAKTEERHLSADPVYVKYATTMNHIGIFRGLYKIFPFLKYDPDRLVFKKWKINYSWQK